MYFSALLTMRSDLKSHVDRLEQTLDTASQTRVARILSCFGQRPDKVQRKIWAFAAIPQGKRLILRARWCMVRVAMKVVALFLALQQ